MLSELPNWEVDNDLDRAPSYCEVERAIGQMSSGKAPGYDGGPALTDKMVTLAVRDDVGETSCSPGFQRCADRSHL